MKESKKTLRRDRVDQERANALKTIRTAVRLKHSLAADTELNEVLPKFEEEFNKAILEGDLPSPLSIAKTILGG
jgi:hypothetical protein